MATKAVIGESHQADPHRSVGLIGRAGLRYEVLSARRAGDRAREVKALMGLIGAHSKRKETFRRVEKENADLLPSERQIIPEDQLFFDIFSFNRFVYSLRGDFAERAEVKLRKRLEDIRRKG